MKVIIPLFPYISEYNADPLKLKECEKALEDFSDTQCPLDLEYFGTEVFEKEPLEEYN